MFSEFKDFLMSNSDCSIESEEIGIITFKYKGYTYLFANDNSDPYYIRLILPNVADTNDERIKKSINEIINKYNSNYKATKFTLVDNRIWISIEQFIYSKENINKLFLRIIQILETVILKFKEEYSAQ